MLCVFLLSMALGPCYPLDGPELGQVVGNVQGSVIGAGVSAVVDRAAGKKTIQAPDARPACPPGGGASCGRINYVPVKSLPTFQWAVPGAVAANPPTAQPANAAAPPESKVPAGDRTIAEATSPDLALVPADCKAFVTLRVAGLLAKLGSRQIEKLPQAVELKRQLGLPLSAIDRLTCVVPAGEGEVLMIIRGTAALPRKSILAACVPDAEVVKQKSKVVHVSKSNGRAVHFCSEQVLIGGEKEAVMRFLQASSATPKVQGTILQVRTLAGNHDLVAWGLDQLFPGLDDPKWTRLGIESEWIAIDVGKELTAECRLCCKDETVARRLVSTLRGLNTGLRAQLLMLNCLRAIKEVFPEEARRSLPVCCRQR